MLNLKTILLSKWMMVVAIIICLSYCFYTFLKPKISQYNASDTSITGSVSSFHIDGDELSMVILGKEKIQGFYYFKSEEEKNEWEKVLGYGDHLALTGNLEIPNRNSLPNTFNYQEYLNQHGIYYVMNITEMKKESNGNLLWQIKTNIQNRIKQYECYSYLEAFILGSTSDLDKEDIRTNGISHLFAVSGMHLTLFISFLSYLFHLFHRRGHLFILFFLTFYLFLVGFSCSVLRAFIFYLFHLANQKWLLQISKRQMIFWTCFILLMVNPYYLFDVGFQYSFIVCFFLSFLKRNNHHYILTLLQVSLISFVASIPISAYHFYQINLLSVIWNLIFVPFVSFILFPASLCYFIFPFFGFIYSFIVQIFSVINQWCADITFGVIIIPKCAYYIWFIYYLCYLLFFKVSKKRYLFYLLFIISGVKLMPYIDSQAHVYYLNVGQGDSSLIITPHLHDTVMIDTGGKLTINKENWQIKKKDNDFSNTIILFLKSIGVRNIQHLILTHGDADHMGYSIHLVQKFSVLQVTFNLGEYNDLENNLLEVLEEKRIPYHKGEDSISMGNMQLQFLNTGLYDNENDNSNVIYFNYDSVQFLFMGDASIKREKDIIKYYHLNHIDFLKVGHHGSNTSSCNEFIQQIKPVNSIISVGKKNRYGHPKESVLELLKSSNIYRTDQDGTIEVIMNQGGYQIKNI